MTARATRGWGRGRGGRRSQRVPVEDREARRDSRRHARLWFENGAWWIEDQESKHGTLVGGHEIKGRGPTRLEPWVEIQMGDTVLMLAPPHWHRLKGRNLVVELEVTPAVNVSLVHCGVPVVSRLMVRNWGAQQSTPGALEISISGCAQAEPIAIPALLPGQSLDVPRPRFRFDHQALENQTERVKRVVSVKLDAAPAWTVEL